MKKTPKYKIDNARLTLLTARAQKGNEKATEEIVNMISGYLYYYCLTMLGNPDAAQDAVQDILLTMLQKLHTLENPSCFLGWIKTVACNYCRGKRSRTTECISLSEGFEDLEDDDEQICPSHSIETEEVCALVREAVMALPAPQRESVMMFYFHQFSVKQIAHVLEISENTVKSRLYSARGTMKKYLEKHGAVAVASCVAAPLTLISFSLISAAENQKDLVVPYVTPKGKVMLAVAKTAAVSSSPVRAAGIACALLAAIGGFGASAYSAGNQLTHTRAETAVTQSVHAAAAPHYAPTAPGENGDEPVVSHYSMTKPAAADAATDNAAVRSANETALEPTENAAATQQTAQQTTLPAAVAATAATTAASAPAAAAFSAATAPLTTAAAVPTAAATAAAHTAAVTAPTTVPAPEGNTYINQDISYFWLETNEYPDDTNFYCHIVEVTTDADGEHERDAVFAKGSAQERFERDLTSTPFLGTGELNLYYYDIEDVPQDEAHPHPTLQTDVNYKFYIYSDRDKYGNFSSDLFLISTHTLLLVSG